MQEFDLISRISAIMGPQAVAPEGVTGIGDDCAVIPQIVSCGADSDLLVSTDVLIENTHFRLATASPEDIGWKSACVNISDIAAMGGNPTYAFLTLGIPSSEHFAIMHTSAEYWVEAFISGFKSACKKYGVVLLGGDTSRSSEVVINVTIHGKCEHGKAVMRDGARPGDLICVSGTLGDSGLGLQILESKRIEAASDDEKYLIQKHSRPQARVELGQKLLALGVHSMMDISDGVAGDLQHILKASAKAMDRQTLGADINLDAIPLSIEYRSLCEKFGFTEASALSAGEDYELLFTADPSFELPQGCTVIGRVREGSGITYYKNGEEQALAIQGFRHF